MRIHDLQSLADRDRGRHRIRFVHFPEHTQDLTHYFFDPYEKSYNKGAQNRRAVPYRSTFGWTSCDFGRFRTPTLVQTHGTRGCHKQLPAKWPSGLKRRVQAAVRKGVGSNPTFVIRRLACYLFCILLSETTHLTHVLTHAPNCPL